MSKKSVYSIIGIIAIIIIFVVSGGTNVIYNIFSPAGEIANEKSQTSSTLFSDLLSVNKLSDRNTELENKNHELESQIASLKEMQIENERLRKELEYKNENSTNNIVAAEVVSKSISPYIKTIQIDKGANDDIATGDVVISSGYLVGTISQLGSDYSFVELITSPDTLISVTLQDSRSEGLLESSLNGFYIDNIPVDDEVSIGEVVVTNNIGSNMTPGVIIGTVSDISTYTSQIFKTLKIDSPINFSKISNVFVIK